MSGLEAAHRQLRTILAHVDAAAHSAKGPGDDKYRPEGLVIDKQTTRHVTALITLKQCEKDHTNHFRRGLAEHFHSEPEAIQIITRGYISSQHMISE